LQQTDVCQAHLPCKNICQIQHLSHVLTPLLHLLRLFYIVSPQGLADTFLLLGMPFDSEVKFILF
jgi:hypothetical protein